MSTKKQEIKPQKVPMKQRKGTRKATRKGTKRYTKEEDYVKKLCDKFSNDHMLDVIQRVNAAEWEVSIGDRTPAHLVDIIEKSIIELERLGESKESPLIQRMLERLAKVVESNTTINIC